MTNEEKRMCIAKTDGTIHAFKNKGLDFPNVVTVCYSVAGKTYSLEESVKIKYSPIKFCGVVVGQKKECMFDITVGKTVTVCYNPNNPHYAHILENVGHCNV